MAKQSVHDLLKMVNIAQEDIDAEISENHEEILDAVEPMAEQQDAVDTIAASLESLDLVIASLESCDTNGLRESDFGILRVATQGIATSLGIESRDLVPSLETQVDSDSERLSVSVEGFKETFTKMIEVAKNAILRAWDYVLTFFSKIFTGYKGLLKKAESLLTKAKALKQPKTEAKIKVASMSRLTFGGKINEHVIPEIADRVHNSAKFFMEDYPSEVMEYFKTLSKLKILISGSNIRIDIPEENIGDFGREQFKVTKANYEKEIIGGVTLVGGEIKTFNKETGGTPLDAIKSLPHLRAVPPEVERKGERADTEGMIIPALDRDKIIKTLESVKTAIKYMESHEKKVSDVRDAAKKAIEEMKSGVQTQRFASEKEKQLEQGFRNILSFFLFFMGRNWSAPMVYFTKLIYGVVRTLLTVAERSIDAYGPGYDPDAKSPQKDITPEKLYLEHKPA